MRIGKNIIYGVSCEGHKAFNEFCNLLSPSSLSSQESAGDCINNRLAPLLANEALIFYS